MTAMMNASRAASPSLTVMTYNIHSCVNVYGRDNPAAIARIIAHLEPDAVALQEVDTMGPRMDYRNQAQWLAAELGMQFHFQALRKSKWGRFGTAVLSKYPLSVVKTSLFPGKSTHQIKEPRGATWVRLHTPRGNVHLINTHLSLRLRDRVYQVRHLLGSGWLGGIHNEPAVFCGDFNAGVRSLEYRTVSTRYVDAQKQVKQKGYPRPTFFSLYPILRLDHIFVSRHLLALEVKVPSDLNARKASDHLPVWARLALREPTVGAGVS
jgi:endonuclease/exonuclease/phosphatase family metal-dependent hydrolase